MLKEFKEFAIRRVGTRGLPFLEHDAAKAVRGMNSLKKKEEAPAAAPTTKECPHCLSVIPLKATRCGHRTSELRAA